MTDQTAADLADQQGSAWRRIVLFALLCGVLLMLAASDTLHAALIEVLAWAERSIDRHPVLGVLAFVAAAAVSAMFAFVSVAVIVPVAVYTWGEPLSVLLLWSGWILGGFLSYGVGRLSGRAAVRWLPVGAALRRLEGRVAHTASFGLVVLFQLALPSEIPGYVLGLVRYHFGKYLLALGLAELPFAVATIYMGAGFVERRSGLILLVGAALISLSVAAMYLLRRQYKAHARTLPERTGQDGSPD